VTVAEYRDAGLAIEAAIAPLGDSRMAGAEGELISDEFRFAADLLKHACQRGEFLLDPSSHDRLILANDLHGLTAEHQRLWRARNREGGLIDSTGRIEQIEIDYR
jgi:hypothetical protein